MNAELTKPGLTPEEADLLAPIERAPILERTLAWAAINSGTANLDGVAAMAGRLADAFAALPGDVRLVDPAPVEKVDEEGHMRTVTHGRHLVVSVRPTWTRSTPRITPSRPATGSTTTPSTAPAPPT